MGGGERGWMSLIIIYLAVIGWTTIRSYAFAGKPPSPYAVEGADEKSVQLVLINLNSAAQSVDVIAENINSNNNSAAIRVEYWTLTAGPLGLLSSQLVCLYDFSGFWYFSRVFFTALLL